jgi:hypothetical protein
LRHRSRFGLWFVVAQSAFAVAVDAAVADAVAVLPCSPTRTAENATPAWLVEKGLEQAASNALVQQPVDK